MANEKRHKPYREFLLGEPCCCYPCRGAVIIHHNTFGQPEQHAKSIPGKRGKGQKASDDEGMPLCNHHHAQLHGLSGYFGGWEKRQLREWQDEQVQRLRNIYAMRHPEPLALPTPAGAARRASTKAPDTVKLSAVLDYITTWSGKRHLDPVTVQALSDLQNDLKASLL